MALRQQSERWQAVDLKIAAALGSWRRDVNGERRLQPRLGEDDGRDGD
jgi:hypothetical protein